ncbi:MAG TPA: helix-turn-helix transcriptional regulator [Pedobacter sp.]|jgi:transcriptional regulator with XRE-family HTH domain
MQRDKLLRKLGLKLRDVRVKKGLSQIQVAILFGKERQTIQRIEAGNTNPSIVYLYELSKVLGVSLKELFADLSEDN